MTKLEDIVFQGIGEASMCWSERPKGVFDSTKAARIGDEIMQAIKEEMSEKTITIEARFFEHLLACLANQKFIHEVNADGMSEGIVKVRSQQAAMQAAIDDAYRQSMEFLMHGTPIELPRKKESK